MDKIIVSYKLKPGKTAGEYEEYFKKEKYAVVMSFPSVSGFRLFRVAQTIEGTKQADFIGEIIVESIEKYAKDRETPEFKKFIEKWLPFVIPESINVSVVKEVSPDNINF